jgi:hypothetical protein
VSYSLSTGSCHFHKPEELSCRCKDRQLLWQCSQAGLDAGTAVGHSVSYYGISETKASGELAAPAHPSVRSHVGVAWTQYNSEEIWCMVSDEDIGPSSDVVSRRRRNFGFCIIKFGTTDLRQDLSSRFNFSRTVPCPYQQSKVNFHSLLRRLYFMLMEFCIVELS